MLQSSAQQYPPQSGFFKTSSGQHALDTLPRSPLLPPIPLEPTIASKTSIAGKTSLYADRPQHSKKIDGSLLFTRPSQVVPIVVLGIALEVQNMGFSF